MTAWYWPLIVAPFIGSFLTVLIVRLPAGRGVMAGRSGCPECGHTLGVVDLIPLAGWAIRRGRCHYCDAAIPALYPLVELAAVAAAAWAAASVPLDVLWPSCVLGWALLALAVTDYREFVLPDEITLPLIPLGLLAAWWIDDAALPHHLIGAAAGFLVFWGIARLYRRLRGREGLGLGDAKLLAAGGAWVSWQGLPGVVLWASLSGLAYALIRSALGEGMSATDRIAFGTHLCLGIWLVWLYGPPVIG